MHAIGTQNEVKYMKKIMFSFGLCQHYHNLLHYLQAHKLGYVVKLHGVKPVKSWVKNASFYSQQVVCKPICLFITGSESI